MRIPQVVERTMIRLCNSIEESTPIIESVYLYGSVALGDYIEGSSDIDFVAVLRYSPTEADCEAILSSHRKVATAVPDADLMGSYLLQKDLGKPPSEITPLLTYYNKEFNVTGLGADMNPVTWWVLKKHGIRIYGSELSFTYDLDTAALLAFVIDNLRSYWARWVDRLENQWLQLQTPAIDPESFTLQLDEAVEWCTLGMLRQLYTLKERDILSKVAAGYYGLGVIPPQWHGLIHEAISIKRGCTDRCYASTTQRLADLIALLRYIQLEANRLAEEGKLSC